VSNCPSTAGLTNLQLLQQTKANVLKTLTEITCQPKPSYSVNGQSISWTEYNAMLTKQVADLNDLIQQEQPFMMTSIGTS
jgi:hypothetical protein